MAPSLIRRLFGPTSEDLIQASDREIKRLLPVAVQDGDPMDTKASGVSLLPAGAYGGNYVFFSPDGGRTFIDTAGESGMTMLAFVAYWYCASRWRATKLAEAPIIVVEEDQDTGMDSWIADHELTPVLEEPSPDYDMGELLEITSHYLDNTGGCLWVMDRDNAGRIARLTPFSYNEFQPQRGPDRVFAEFIVQTMAGPKTKIADDVCFFRDNAGGTGFSVGGQGISSWGRGRSRLDVAMTWLSLGDRAQKTVRSLLDNSVWPSAVISPDKEWDPDPKLYEQYKQDLRQYGKRRQGEPFVALGGATFTQIAAKIKDLVPTEILDRVESVVAAVSGVPAIVLQFEVGLKNAPWSHMVQARRMAYEDTIAPNWRKMERVITRQMLRPSDDDPTHYLRFDKTDIDSLKRDQLESAQIAATMGDAASLNERRATMGLEPSQDPKADEIPELTKPSMADIMAGMAKKPTGITGSTSENGPPDPMKATPASVLQRKFKGPVLINAFRVEAIPAWKITTQGLLTKDADEIAQLVESLITESVHKSMQSKIRGKDRAMSAVNRYLQESSKKAWSKAMLPLYAKASTRAGAVVSADMNVGYNYLNANLLKFAQKNTTTLISGVSKTTSSLVSDIIQGGLDANASVKDIAQLIRDATGFSKSRAELIARTETTRAFNGAPTEALQEYGTESGRVFTKTWFGVMDEKERDEHVAMEGETVGVDEPFSNGSFYPDEPNCRCSVVFTEEEV